MKLAISLRGLATNVQVQASLSLPTRCTQCCPLQTVAKILHEVLKAAKANTAFVADNSSNVNCKKDNKKNQYWDYCGVRDSKWAKVTCTHR